MNRQRNHGFQPASEAEAPGPRIRHIWPARGPVLFTYLSILILVIVSLLSQFFKEWLPSVAQSTVDVSPVESLDHPAAKTRSFLLNPREHAFRRPQTQHHHWRITADYRRPDGVRKLVYLINGQFPGPTVEARPGDVLTIEVENALTDDEGVTLHWHGLHMRGSNRMDGAAWITQSPIMPGESFTYNFKISDDQHGTFWYHAHDATQRADGLYGGFIIHQVAKAIGTHQLDEQFLLLVSDWYHRSAQDALQAYSHPGAFGLETVPDSVLLNGQGSFQCINAVPSRPLDCQETIPSQLNPLRFEAGKRYSLRVVNVGAYAALNLTLHESVLTALSVDGDHAVEARPAQSVGWIHPGERVNVLVDRYLAVSHSQSWLEISLDEANFKYENTALALYHQFPVQWVGNWVPQPMNTKAISEQLDIQNARSAHSQSGVLPTHASTVMVLYAVTQKLTKLKNEPRGFINRTTWRPQASPRQPLLQLSRDQWDSNQFVPTITYNVANPLWVDIVLNNLDEEGHPFHLHGHDFWVLSTYSSTFNWGSYNPYEEYDPPGGQYDLKTPVKKDTVFVPRRGYAVIRLRADNPGLWQFHCHVLWHLGSGMSMALEVAA